jgi:hypothetical protein
MPHPDPGGLGPSERQAYQNGFADGNLYTVTDQALAGLRAENKRLREENERLTARVFELEHPETNPRE